MNTDLFLSFEQQLKKERGYKKELDFKAYKGGSEPSQPAQVKEKYSAWGNVGDQNGFTPSSYNQSQMDRYQSVIPKLQDKLYDTTGADTQARAYADNLKSLGLKRFKQDQADALGTIQSNNARRFGSLSNSDYDSNLKTLSRESNSALEDMNTQYDTNYQNALDNYQGYNTNNLNSALNGMGNLYNLSNGLSQNALNSSNATNNFNMTGYQNQLAQYNADQANKGAMYQLLGSAIGGIGGSLLGPASTAIGSKLGGAVTKRL